MSEGSCAADVWWCVCLCMSDGCVDVIVESQYSLKKSQALMKSCRPQASQPCATSPPPPSRTLAEPSRAWMRILCVGSHDRGLDLFAPLLITFPVQVFSLNWPPIVAGAAVCCASPLTLSCADPLACNGHYLNVGAAAPQHPLLVGRNSNLPTSSRRITHTHTRGTPTPACRVWRPADVPYLLTELLCLRLPRCAQ